MSFWQRILAAVLLAVYEAACAISRKIRPKILRNLPPPEYWVAGRSDFKKITYNTGDVVWVSKRTEMGYSGVTYDNICWSSFTSPLEY